MKRTRTLKELSAVFGAVAIATSLGAWTCYAQPGTSPGRATIPYVATHSDAAQDMLWMANVDKEDVVYDLGSGDGRIVIAATRDFSARRAVGIEIDPKLILESRRNAEDAGIAERVEFLPGDLFKQDFRQATVVTLFLGHDPNIKLRPKMFSSLKPGTRIVSHQFGMGEWGPDKTLRVRTPVLGMIGIPVGPFTFNPHVPDYVGNERHFDSNDDRIHCWLIPARVSGIWRGKIKSPDGSMDCRIILHQRLSKVTGTFEVNGTTDLTGNVEAELWGDHLRFASTPYACRSQLRFDGHVHENTMRGTLAVTEQGKTRELQWQAQREPADLTGAWEWSYATGERMVTLRVERRDDGFIATYLDGRQSIPVTDFYDHGGGLYFTRLIGPDRHGGLRIAKDAGWLLGEGIVEDGQLKGQMEFYPSGSMAFEGTGGMKPPKPIVRDWTARRVESSRGPIIEEVQQDGADQPATAPESKAEGEKKPKHESEVRPQ